MRWVVREIHLPFASVADYVRDLVSGRLVARRPTAPSPGISVAAYAAQWLDSRRRRGIETVRDDESRLRVHVLPVLGQRPLSAVRPREIRELVERLIQEGRLAPGTIRNVYSTVRTLFRDAVLYEVAPVSPCVLPRSILPSERDRRAWSRRRRPSIFSADEVNSLLGDRRVPDDRRAFYALLFFTGMRHGEAAGRRWRDLALDSRPLAAIAVATQYDNAPLKTNVPRVIPIHPVLETTLSEWHRFGFKKLLGRPPTSDDFIIPSRRGTCRTRGTTLRNLQRDCSRIAVTIRRTHDTRHTFISRARRGGARKDIIKRITHNTTGDIVDHYTHVEWDAFCQAISCVQY